MDAVKLILTETASPLGPLEHSNKIGRVPEEEKKQFAKDFESVFIHRLLEEMKNTIGHWGFEEDGVSEQVEDIFWLYLARDIANKGGFGMWKSIYHFLTNSTQENAAAESLDKNV